MPTYSSRYTNLSLHASCKLTLWLTAQLSHTSCHSHDCLSAEQLRLKYDHNELKGRVAEAEQKVQDNLSGQHQDRAAFRTLQSQVAKLEFGEQRLQQQTAGMAEALEDMIRRKSPSVLWQMSQEAVRLPLCLLNNNNNISINNTNAFQLMMS